MAKTRVGSRFIAWRCAGGSAQSGRLRVRGFLLFPNAVCTSAALGGEGQVT